MPTTSASRVIHAPQRDVWALLSDVSRAGVWNKYWVSIDFLTPQTHGAGTRFTATTEAGDAFVFDVCEWESPKRISFCPVRDPGERYQVMLKSHLFEVRALSDEDCELTITAHATASGLRGRIISMFFWSGHQKDGLNAALDAIQSQFEPEKILRNNSDAPEIAAE